MSDGQEMQFHKQQMNHQSSADQQEMTSQETRQPANNLSDDLTDRTAVNASEQLQKDMDFLQQQQRWLSENLPQTPLVKKSQRVQQKTSKKNYPERQRGYSAKLAAAYGFRYGTLPTLTAAMAAMATQISENAAWVGVGMGAVLTAVDTYGTLRSPADRLQSILKVQEQVHSRPKTAWLQLELFGQHVNAPKNIDITRRAVLENPVSITRISHDTKNPNFCNGRQFHTLTLDTEQLRSLCQAVAGFKAPFDQLAKDLPAGSLWVMDPQNNNHCVTIRADIQQENGQVVKVETALVASQLKTDRGLPVIQLGADDFRQLHRWCSDVHQKLPAQPEPTKTHGIIASLQNWLGR